MSAPGLLIILLLLGSRLINEIDGITEDRAEVVVVKVETGLEEVRRLAARHGYKVEGQVKLLKQC